MRIVSVNAWGGAMYDSLAPWVRDVAADVLCLQEVTLTPGATGWTTFTDAERTLPQRASLHADVRTILPSHHAVFVASDAGPVQDADGHTHVQQFGLGTYVTEQLAVTGYRSAYVHGSYATHEQWAVEDRPRVAVATSLADPASGFRATIIQVHGLRDPAGKHDTPARVAQAERLAELVRRTRSPDAVTVLCGDLNVLPDSRTFAILADAGMTDLVGTADTRTSRYTKPARSASYLLVSEPVAVRRFEVLAAPEVSDHRALLLDL